MMSDKNQRKQHAAWGAVERGNHHEDELTFTDACLENLNIPEKKKTKEYSKSEKQWEKN